jgi:hypothetical protein
MSEIGGTGERRETGGMRFLFLRLALLARLAHLAEIL